MDHPPKSRLRDFLNGQLDDDQLYAVGAHVDSCDVCREQMKTVLLSGDTFVSQVQSAARASCTRNDENALQVARAAIGDDYECQTLLGRGGMGLVVRALDRKLNRPVAIKLLAPELAADPDSVSRFVREAQTAAAVRHENVAEIHSIKDTGQLPYIVMELIEGETLQERLTSSGPMLPRQIVAYGSQIANGLAAAHSRGLIHRDIKPANILMENETGRVKLTDFGLARAVDDSDVTRAGQILGTPPWMSPEQARGEPADERSDLFSLGSVLYAMCTGTAPFRAASSVAVLRAVCDDQPESIHRRNTKIPTGIVNLVNRLMAKDPQRRPNSATVVARQLSTASRTTSKLVSYKVVVVTVLSVIITAAVLTYREVSSRFDSSIEDVAMEHHVRAPDADSETEEPGNTELSKIESSTVMVEFPAKLLPSDGEIEVISCLLNSETFSKRRRLSIHGNELHVEAQNGGNFIRVPLRIDGDYELSLSFVRVRDDESKGSCNVVLPIRSDHIAFVLNGFSRHFEGFHSGLGRIDNAPPWDNETTVRTSITTGQKYQVDIHVKSDELTAAVDISMDGQRLTSWTGLLSQLGTAIPGRRVQPGNMEFGAWGNTEIAFRELRLKMTSGVAELCD